MTTDKKPSSKSSSRTGSSGKTAEEGQQDARKGADQIALVMKRNKDLQNRSFKMLGVTVTLALTLGASLVANVYMGTRAQPEPRYLIQQNDGTLVATIPLSKPITNKAAIIQMVTEAVGKLHAIDFKNYKSQLSDASGYFTQAGWKKYMAELAGSGTIQAIEQRQLVLSSTVVRPPVITKEYEIAGVKAWEVEVPYMVQYFGAGFNSSVNLVAKITVIRVRTTDSPSGVAIAGFDVVRAKEN